MWWIHASTFFEGFPEEPPDLGPLPLAPLLRFPDIEELCKTAIDNQKHEACIKKWANIISSYFLLKFDSFAAKNIALSNGRQFHKLEQTYFQLFIKKKSFNQFFKSYYNNFFPRSIIYKHLIFPINWLFILRLWIDVK